MQYDVGLKKKMEESFLTYAGHVILQRSTPDARDCLKYSARQLLYAQLLEKLTSDKPYKKAQKSVSAGMSRFYVHGDSSAYGTLIRMGKPFALRYPLEDVRGNFGTLINPEDHSASRYVEMRMTQLSNELFTSLNKNTIEDWIDSYDKEDKFPSVLPTIGYYNIVNGCSGIGVSMATSIPQFNLKEVNDAIVKMIRNPEVTFEDVYCPIDFATGGVIINEEEVKESLRLGHGKSAKVRAKIDYDVNTHQLIVTEMPYSVYTNTVCEQLSALIEEDEDCGIDKFIDVTGKKCCIKITLNKKANPEKVRQWLYTNTSLQYYYGINMTMLSQGKFPKVFGWVEALAEHIEHSKDCLRRELSFDMKKALDRLHIVNGYLKALSIIDEVVATIRACNSTAKATSELMNKFEFSEVQAKSILDLKLQRLVNMEISKIEKERDDLRVKIDELDYILNHKEAFDNELISRIEKVTAKYKDERRTINMNIGSVDSDEPIVEKNLVVTITKNGLIYPLEIEQFTTQSRGGKGLKLKLQPNDYILDTIYGSNSDSIIMFSNLGKAYTLKLHELAVGVETYVNGFFELAPDEYITSIIPYNKLNDYKYVIFATKYGMIKKTKLSEYQAKRKTGLQGIKLREGDQVIGMDFITDETDNVVLVTKQGYTLVFNQNGIPLSGRVTMGVKAMKLSTSDELVSVNCYNSLNKPIGLLTVTKNGLSKCTSLDEFSITNRALKGVIGQKFKTEDDYVTAAVVLNESNKEVLCISSSNIIRIKTSELQKSKRDTMGTTLMKLKSNEVISQLVALD